MRNKPTIIISAFREDHKFFWKILFSVFSFRQKYDNMRTEQITVCWKGELRHEVHVR